MHERYLHTLESNNIPVVVLNLKSYEDVKHSMLTIGKIMRKDDKAQKVVANLDKDINATVSKLPKSERSDSAHHQHGHYYGKGNQHCRLLCQNA